MKKEKELEVLKEVQAETERFLKKLKKQIADRKSDKTNNNYGKYIPIAHIKRAAIDLKLELSRISTASGSNGVYYYENG